MKKRENVSMSQELPFRIVCCSCSQPDRPLVTGEVVPAHALAMGLVFLLVAVLSAWAVHPAALQVNIPNTLEFL